MPVTISITAEGEGGRAAVTSPRPHTPSQDDEICVHAMISECSWGVVADWKSSENGCHVIYSDKCH